MIYKGVMTRRGFLKATLIGLGGATLSTLGWPGSVLAADPADVFNFVKDPDNPTELEAEHLMEVRLPLIAEDGANVPIIISLENHPMEPDHYIKSIQIVGFNDPIVSKGVYQLSPANGQAYFSTQMRMDGGDTEVYVIAECSQHGKWVASQGLKVSLGGC